MRLSLLLLLLLGCQAPQTLQTQLALSSSPQKPNVRTFVMCLSGPDKPWPYLLVSCERMEADPLWGSVCRYHRFCVLLDAEQDGDVDLADYARWQRNPGGR